MRTEACVDTRVRRRKSEDVLERRMLCLDGRLGEVRGLTTRFAAAPDPELVERATRAVHALGDLAGCADTQALTSPVRPPADPDLRAKVAALRVELGAVKALQYAGRFREGRDQARPLAARAAALGYRPLEAEAQLLLGMLESNAGDGKAASAALDKAVWA